MGLSPKLVLPERRLALHFLESRITKKESVPKHEKRIKGEWIAGLRKTGLSRFSKPFLNWNPSQSDSEIPASLRR